MSAGTARRARFGVRFVAVLAGVAIAPTSAAKLPGSSVDAGTPAVPVTAARYPPLNPSLLAAVDAQRERAHAEVVVSSASVPPSDMPAARRFATVLMSRSGCGLGSGAWVDAAGYVTGSFANRPVLAVFLDPAGAHAGLGAGGAEPSTTHVTSPPMNWYVGFLIPGGRVVGVRADGTTILGPHIVCAFGHSPRLPPLPTHPGKGFF